ncbi:MAG: type II toxin-antitoxin system PemK/MazF family toxin [Nakamurella sp.]
MKRGDLYTAAVRGVYRGKPRPAVIVQDDRFDATESVTVCPLTTVPIDASFARIDIEPSAFNGLDRLSWLMVDKVFTIPRAGLRDHVGALSSSDIVRLDRALLVFLGLAD